MTTAVQGFSEGKGVCDGFRPPSSSGFSLGRGASVPPAGGVSVYGAVISHIAVGLYSGMNRNKIMMLHKAGQNKKPC